jgi:UDP-N-acetylmuramate--alanine ligase
VVFGDARETLEIAQSARCPVFSYGFSEDCNYRILNLELKKEERIHSQSFEVLFGDTNLGRFEIQLVGRHNALNALAVIASCHRLNIGIEKIHSALKEFRGTKRRFEFIGLRRGAILIDDYGHHPDEIKATMRAARELYPEKNIWAVFHPHTFTRTKALLSEFSQSFSDADKVIVLDIYGSARETQGGVHSKDLVELINKYDRGKSEYIPTIDVTVEFLRSSISKEDVVIAIGAGNVWEVVEKLKEK